jgi:hypothetical protein
MFAHESRLQPETRCDDQLGKPWNQAEPEVMLVSHFARLIDSRTATTESIVTTNHLDTFKHTQSASNEIQRRVCYWF